MSHVIPKEPEAFTKLVARRFGKELRRIEVHITGPLELLVDGYRVDLDDLHRAMQHHKAQAEAEAMLQRFIDAFVSTQRLMDTSLPLEMVRSRIFPQIRSLEKMRHTSPDQIVAQPFINDTFIIYMIDLKDTAGPVSTEQLIKWGVDADDLDHIARQNLAQCQPGLELQLFKNDDTTAALFNTGDGYDASRLLLDQLYPKLSPEMGGNFLVAIPTRDVFIAFPDRPSAFLDKLLKRISSDFRVLPYPITSDLFLVTMDGVAPWSRAA